MSLDAHALPSHQFACLMPVPVSDYMHYQFYEICPASCLYVAYPLPVKSFEPDGAEEALEKLPRAIDFLSKRGVSRITFAGLPIAAALGRDRCLALRDSIRKTTDIPFDFDAEESAEALKQLGAKAIAIAGKWPPSVMERIAAYMTHAGFKTLGYSSDKFTADQATGVTPEGSAKLAIDLARSAMDANPDADTLLLGGGAWLSLPAIREIEDHYRKPVVSNTVASCWAGLRQAGLKGRSGGLGRLIETL